jgi:1,4-alpha-glucan branching enzyme
MWAHPGKKLLFMGGELAQSAEWNFAQSLDWHLLDHPEHSGVQDLVRSLNRHYRAQPALFERDFTPDGFRWIDASDAGANVLSFLRLSAAGSPLACVANLSPVTRPGYRVGLPTGGEWRELLNTDAEAFAGSGVGTGGAAPAGDADSGGGRLTATEESRSGLPWSVELTLPPLAVVWLVPAS